MAASSSVSFWSAHSRSIRCGTPSASQRRPLALRWTVFGLAALAACCVTPYGWGSILASRKILDLGELLHLIYEWMPADFSRFGAVRVSPSWRSIAGALYSGVRLSPPRIALVLGLLHMALSHVRNLENFALLLPLVVLGPVSAQFSLRGGTAGQGYAADRRGGDACRPARRLVRHRIRLFAARQPVTCSRRGRAESAQSRRVLNDLPFGGYLIWRQMPVFIDGRAELYGEKFEMAYYRALQLKDIDELFDILRNYDIDAVLLTPGTPASRLFDHLGGWQRVYADEHAVLHRRIGAEPVQAPIQALKPSLP